MFVVDTHDYNDDFDGDPKFLKTDIGNTAKFYSQEEAHRLMELDIDYFISKNLELGEYEKEIKNDYAKVEFKTHGHGCEWRIREIK